MEDQGIPVHRGYYIEDLRTVELAPWSARNINAAFMQLHGMQGVVEARIEEIPAGATLDPLKMAVDELVYVLNGRGVASVWSDDASPKKTFEWSTRSLFLIPRNNYCQLGNMDGNNPVRLLHYNFLPIAMSAVPEPDFFFNNPYVNSTVLQANGGEFYSEAAAEIIAGEGRFAESGRQIWKGNFFPDMQAWDKLVPFWGRGAGGHVVFIQTPGSEMRAHMSVFPERSYKKGHRHGPGRVIVIPGGVGYSVLWPDENSEKIVIPWQEASCFVPPNRWFHQHFNLGTSSARYLALHPPEQFAGRAEKVEDRANDQIEYPAEDPWVREYFETELDKRGMTSAIPAEAYKNLDFEWDYAKGD
jgi:hypothetical protein